MSAPDPAAKPPFAALLVGAVLASAGVGAVLAMRLPFAPTPAECRLGRVDGGAVWLAAGGCALAAAGLAAVALRWTGRSGAFGAVAAVVLAAGVPALTAAATGDATGAAAAAAVAVVVVAASGSLLRERGMLSLAVVTAVAAAPMLVALRLARLDGFAARPIGNAMRAAAALPPDATTVGLVLAKDLDDATVAALPLALAPRAVLAARADSGAAAWLLRMGLPVLRCARDRAELAVGALDVPLRGGGLTVTAQLLRDQAGEPTGLSIACERARVGHLAIVLTPVGDLVAEFDGNGRATLDGDNRARLRAWLAPMPTPPAIRVLVVPPGPADVYGWTDLRP